MTGTSLIVAILIITFILALAEFVTWRLVKAKSRLRDVGLEMLDFIDTLDVGVVASHGEDIDRWAATLDEESWP